MLQEEFLERISKDKKVMPYSQGINSWGEDSSEYPRYVFIGLNTDGTPLPLSDKDLEYIDSIIDELNKRRPEIKQPVKAKSGKPDTQAEVDGPAGIVQQRRGQTGADSIISFEKFILLIFSQSCNKIS